MKQLSLPTYAEINKVLSKTALKLNASQVHGLICGILCAHPQASTSAWEQMITGNESAETHEVLQALYHTSAKQLDEFLFEFKLVLPPDSYALPERAEALTLWCQGFLTGLKLVNIAIEEREASEMTEAINDLIEIAKMDYEEVVASEEDEVAYVELVEYIRMAIILIYQDTAGSRTEKQTTSPSDHLH